MSRRCGRSSSTAWPSLNREQRIDAISITTHGATGALVDAAGELVLPVLDYEFDGPDRLAAEYDAIRPPFAETGTPRLPLGLNLGAQFFWQQKRFPAEFAKAAAMLMYPQYWALAAHRRGRQRGDLARLPHRSVEPVERGLFVDWSTAWVGAA